MATKLDPTSVTLAVKRTGKGTPMALFGDVDGEV